MTSDAKTVAEYLESLPEDRRAAIAKIRASIKKKMPKGIAEQMQYGMIGYVVPLKLYPNGYHCDPSLPVTFAALASQKNNMALYMMTPYQHPPVAKMLREGYAARKMKLDMGKSCIRFKKLEDLPLDLIGNALAAVPLDEYLAEYEKNIPRSAKAKPKSKPAKAAKAVKRP